MVLRNLFPRMLLTSIAFTIAISANAQTQDRVTAQNIDQNEISCSPEDVTSVVATNATSSRPAWEAKPKPIIDISSKSVSLAGFSKFQPALLAAIDTRLGAPYSWGATGPRSFDCSGFVWSIFQTAGIDFERGSARTLFARFAPATADEQYKFGTLVFFSGLAHVGVVADEHGFYHASRHHGVIYSPFNEYWMKRIDGFRRVPLPAPIAD
jgi:cell wall-associated NlpC family hydrolase